MMPSNAQAKNGLSRARDARLLQRLAHLRRVVDPVPADVLRRARAARGQQRPYRFAGANGGPESP